MTAPARPAGPAPVTPVGAAVVLAGAMVVAALLSVSVARILPGRSGGDDDLVTHRLVPIPVTAAPAPALAGIPPTVTFDDDDAALPAPFEVVAGAWSTGDGQGRATEVGPAGALAVMPAPGATAAQVTLVVTRPGAGLVVDYLAPDRYVALIVGRGGRSVEMVEVDGDRSAPRRLALAPLSASAGPLVLALERSVVGVGAYANGEQVGRRLVAEPEGDWRIGLVTGFRARADEARFDDLTVA